MLLALAGLDDLDLIGAGGAVAIHGPGHDLVGARRNPSPEHAIRRKLGALEQVSVGQQVHVLRWCLAAAGFGGNQNIRTRDEECSVHRLREMDGRGRDGDMDRDGDVGLVVERRSAVVGDYHGDRQRAAAQPDRRGPTEEAAGRVNRRPRRRIGAKSEGELLRGRVRVGGGGGEGQQLAFRDRLRRDGAQHRRLVHQSNRNRKGLRRAGVVTAIGRAAVVL